MLRKPPEQYRTKVGILKNVMVDYHTSSTKIKSEEQPIDQIKDAVIRMNKIVIYVYQFIKAYYLYCLHNNLELPDILDENFIRLCFRAVSDIQEKRGTGLSNQQQKDHMVRLLDFYEHEFSSVVIEPLPLRDSLTQCILYSCNMITTNIRNNITMHFTNRVKKTIFEHCFVQYRAEYSDEQWKAFSKSERKNIRTIAQQHAKLIQKDILNYKSSAPEQYRDWIEAIGRTFVPAQIIPSRYSKEEAYKDKICYDVKVRPLEYLKCMVRMNQYLEWLGVKQFNAFPLQTDIVPKHIELDTAVLEALLLGTAQTKLIKSSEIEESDSFIEKRRKDRKYKVWSLFFDLNHKMFKSGPFDPITRNPSYVFDYGIKTDGVDICVRFVRVAKSPDDKKSKYEPKSKKLGSEEPVGPKKAKESELQQGPEGKKLEFPYFEDLSDEQIQALQNSHRIYIDPGKENIIYCMDDEPRVGTRRNRSVPKANVFKYTRKQRVLETGRSKNQETIRRYKKDNQLGPIEAHISIQNSKTCNYDSFMTYLLVKNEANRKRNYMFYYSGLKYEFRWVLIDCPSYSALLSLGF